MALSGLPYGTQSPRWHFSVSRLTIIHAMPLSNLAFPHHLPEPVFQHIFTPIHSRLLAVTCEIAIPQDSSDHNVMAVMARNGMV